MRNKIIIVAVFAFIFAASSIDVNAQRAARTKNRTARSVQNIRINLTEKGYRPANFRLKKGVPARLTFVRQTEDECGREIVIPAYRIRRELPLNEPVTINFTPRKAGTFGFACGMNMLRGKIIVQ